MIKTSEQLLEKIALGETSFVQLKREITDIDKFESEIVAFANTQGGYLLIGVANNKEIVGLSDEQIEDFNQKNGNICSQRINPPVNTLSNVLKIEDKKILLIEVPNGVSKPYFTKSGIAWAKVGSDKRKLGRDELKRLFQASLDFYPDEMPVPSSTVADIDLAYFSNYYFQLMKQTMSDSGFEIPVLLKRVGIMEGENLNLAGLLYFGLNPQQIKPVFHVKAVAFVGNDIAGTQYRDSIDITGKTETQYRLCLDFCKRNLRYTQQRQGFNSTGILEISEIALEEALINAFFHRDYTKSSPIRLLIFDDRLEIISPGALPNHLSLDNIKHGDTVIRNNRMVSFGTKILPFRGLGSGINRILKEHPKTDFVNDVEGQQFKVIFERN
jgi:ATP-dependent DNA helicase RecG